MFDMKEEWGNLINIAQDIGGVVDEDEDYSDEGGPRSKPWIRIRIWTRNEDEDDLSIAPKHVSYDTQDPTEALPFSPTEERADEEDQGLTNHERTVSTQNKLMCGADGIKERWKALRARCEWTSVDNAGFIAQEQADHQETKKSLRHGGDQDIGGVVDKDGEDTGVSEDHDDDHPTPPRLFLEQADEEEEEEDQSITNDIVENNGKH
ncbi:hypothetical protein F5887DRAFT_924533 [Amanita rubescens]|nr:hypothetical protein F5887DRAFT_924533 [Amanita rubescens]